MTRSRMRWALIAGRFATDGLVADRERYDGVVAKARQAIDSRLAGLGALALGYAATMSLALSIPDARLPAWYAPSDPAMGVSPAGWWHVGVSLPLLLALVFWWLWRIAVWGLLLWRIAQCELRLVGSHPDAMAGLGFLGASLGAFVPVAAALSTIAASGMAQVLVDGGALTTDRIVFNVLYLVIVGGVIAAPVLVFTPRLMQQRRTASAAYGNLALRAGRAFEHRWIASDRDGVDDEMLRVQDFSATIDLYSIVANARAIQVIPMRRSNLLALVAALAIPFLPIVLMYVPVSVILRQLRSVLL